MHLTWKTALNMTFCIFFMPCFIVSLNHEFVMLRRLWRLAQSLFLANAHLLFPVFYYEYVFSVTYAVFNTFFFFQHKKKSICICSLVNFICICNKAQRSISGNLVYFPSRSQVYTLKYTDFSNFHPVYFKWYSHY